MKPSIVLGLSIMMVLAALTGGEVFAAMTSTNYEIRFDSLGSGGDDTSSSASYQLRDTTGTTSGQGSSSTSYQVNAGFRSGIFDPAVDFDVFIQDRSSQVAATAITASTVTVTSTASFAVGDMIVVVQDEGASQVSAIGEIIGIADPVLTVDAFTDGGVFPVIDGTGDVVYTLDGTALSLGTLSDSIVTTSIVAWEANVDTDDGYSVFVFEDTELTTGSADIADVADGSVTAGSSEYGGISSDTTLASSTFDTVDTAFTSSPGQIGSRSSVEFSSRDFLTIKLAISSSQTDGTYAHELNFVYVGDY